MFELTHWKDQEMRRLRRDMDRLFDRMFYGFGFSGLPREFVNQPRLRLMETEDAVILEAEIPAVDPTTKTRADPSVMPLSSRSRPMSPVISRRSPIPRVLF